MKLDLHSIQRATAGYRGATMRARSLLLTILLACLPPAALGQDTSVQRARAEWETVRKSIALRSIQRGEAIIKGLEALATQSDAVRGEACAFLRDIVAMRSKADQVYRWRVAAVRAMAFLAADTKSIDFLLKIGANRSREVSGLDFFIERALARVDHPKVVRHLLGLLKKGGNTARLAMVIGGLSRLESARAREHLSTAYDVAARLAKNGNPEVRSRAMELIGAMSGSLGPLQAGVKDGKALVRLSVARGLGRRPGDAVAAGLLEELLVDTSAVVREESVLALGRWTDQSPVPALVGRLSKEPMRIRASIAESLKRLTGLDHGPDPEPWRSWLRSARAAGRFDPRAKPGVTGTRKPAGPRYATPRYYGLPVLSDRMVFVLDISGSMATRTVEGGTRLERAKRELEAVLAKLDKRSKYNIVVFSSGIAAMERGSLKPATRKFLEHSKKFLKKLGPRGATNSYGVLEYVFQNFKDVDTIYFLSDGTPTVGKTTVQERIVQRIHDANRLRGVRIHTIGLLSGRIPRGGLEDKDDAARFMELLAKMTGGKFIRVD